ncbi:diguanylate cyclase [Desulfoluna sp.]|uniref:diguanylate cyclase n=1 Tax=Desulfoluna sp. TaxID=2045199 RepID=UPI002607419C|nr:diguanylate cyclase [Desulfoluna sp.]
MMGDNSKKRMILSVVFFLLLVTPVGAFQLSLFVPRDDTVFWASLVELTQSAADDLGVNLKVYNAGNRADTMLEQVKRSCLQGTDGLIFMNYENLGEEILSLSDTFKVPALLYNTGFADPLLIPRKKFPFWLGSMTPDDVRAGGLLAERLIEVGKGAGMETIHLLAIEGNPLEKSSVDRVEGMKAVVSNREDVVLYDIANAGKAWSRTRAKEVFTANYRQHPDINVVWAAGDDIALGVLDAMVELGLPWDQVLTGGIDWSDKAVGSIQAGQNRLSVGGHMLEGAWSLILLYDYLNGVDFSQENTVFKTRMHAIDRINVDQVSKFLSGNWGRIDFKGFSKFHHDMLLYRFDLHYLIDTFYPKSRSFKLTEPERRWLAEHPTIRLGIDFNWPPFEFLGPKENYEGMVADYVRILEDRLGIEFVYSKEMAWSETLASMQERRLDMISAIATIPYYEKAMNLTEPFLSFPLVIITHEDVDFVEELAVLTGRKVAVVEDYSEEKILAGGYPDIELYPANTTEEALEAVATGKAYAYVGNLAVANYAIKKGRFTNLKVSGTMPRKLEISMGVRSDWPIFSNLVTKTMNSISDEERDTIYRRWITLRYEHGFDYALLWKFLAGAAFILSLSIYWNRRLSSLNRKLKQEIVVRIQAEDALQREQERVKQLAVTDPMTGLYNRRKFTEAFPLEIRRLRRDGQFLAFAIMDIDFFKQYNDCYGHQMGDEALIRVGHLLLERCKRATDYVFRLGGEEFGVLFVARNPERALVFIDRLRAAIQGLGIAHRHNKAAETLTVSFGLITSDHPSTMDAMYKAADQALYRAKEAGRNRTEMGS